MSSIPRSLQRRPSHTHLASTRRFRVVLSLVLTTTVLLSTIYLLSDPNLAELSSSASTYFVDTVYEYTNYDDPDFDSDVGWNDAELEVELPTEDAGLWTYVVKANGEDAWRWVGKQRSVGYRRPSWGGLSQQGPKANVRTNLNKDQKYLTTFPEAGWNNQVMEASNLIAVALRTGRIPILAPFVPDGYHLQHRESFLSVSEVFDLSELVAQYHVPMIDQFELKVGEEDIGGAVDDRHLSVVYDGEFPQLDRKTQKPLTTGQVIQAEWPEVDQLHCWNSLLPVQEREGWHIGSWWPIAIEPTPLPISVYADNKAADQRQFYEISLPRTAETVASYSREGDALPQDSIKRLEHLGRNPSHMSTDDPIGCVQHMYYLHMNPEKEDVRDDWRNGVGAWDEVGRYLKFQPGLLRLAEDLMRDLMGIGAGDRVPPYMAVHIRRTDFSDNYRNTTQRYWAHSTWRLLHEIKDMQGVDIRHVVFATDETDEEWLQPLKDLGWIHVDHLKTKTGEKLGWWFPTILDSVILSSAKVFLGVPSSTMSILPNRRVLDWEGGIGRFIQDPTTYEVPENWEWAHDW